MISAFRTRLHPLLAVLVLAGCRTIDPPASPPSRTPPPSPPDLAWPDRIPTEETFWPINSVPGFEIRARNGESMEIWQVGWNEHQVIYQFGPDGDLHNAWKALLGIDGSLVASSDSYLVASISNPRTRSDGTRFEEREIHATDVHVISPVDAQPRGTLIMLASLARMTPQEQSLLESMLREGWTILTSCPPIPQSSIKGGQAIDPDRHPAGSGRRFASIVDDQFAEWGMALETIINRRLEERRPLPSPMVLIGVSMGAIGAAPVAARIDQTSPIRAAVLVSGGTNLGKLLGETTLGEADFKIRQTGDTPTPQATRTFEEAYQDSVVLDSPRLLQWLGKRPVLVIEGESDTAVSRRSRHEFHGFLGEPERWRYPVGHVGMFLVLPEAADDIAEWLDEWSPKPAKPEPGNAP